MTNQETIANLNMISVAFVEPVTKEQRKLIDDTFDNAIKALEQEPKTGHWIKSRDCYGNHHFTCSECGNDIATQYADNWEDKYCSECGCRMFEPQERSDKE